MRGRVSDDRLFDVPEVPVAKPDEKLSPTRRLTIRNQTLLAQGVHPATRRPIAGIDETCGSCAHCTRFSGSIGRVYIKCDLHRLGRSHSEASDIRASWPACELWKSPDDEDAA